VGEVIGVKS